VVAAGITAANLHGIGDFHPGGHDSIVPGRTRLGVDLATLIRPDSISIREATRA
jgi:hypothetical protein